MQKIFVALGWATVLILFPLAARIGLVDMATIKSMTPTLTVFAVLHLTALNRGSRCLPNCISGAA